ncbi:DUF4178 domain-containing protein [Flavobacterium alkalisoli]|uniref:DUF4178 domain-containing protein n=1 Tax=Flavobacterium alkalisoli TaxID=2602769 RepID=A0A5B9FWI9_9FLAO|nr:DUF4178 domain-containing protein [Flavobacterium alkalisoli]QEE49082.1 DUF4178 domain-containing protein [Flavobacterium alkalisoli]
MTFTCPECNTKTQTEVPVNAVNFACPNCSRLFGFNKVGESRELKKYKHESDNIVLKTGQKAKLFGKEYEVTGAIVKKVPPKYFWREYILVSKDGEKRYLSETNGHWIFLEESPDLYDVSYYPRTLTHNNIQTKLYDYASCSIVQCEGFFDFEIPSREIKMVEYINPPYVVSIEITGKDEVTYFGKHISASDVKKAFKIEHMPEKTGVGIVQPYLFDVRNMAIILSCFALLILIGHLIIYSGREETTVLSKNMNFSEFNNKDYVSDSFVLNGASAPLTIALSSDVNNSWAALQVALINESTNEEIYASKDIEYYHGYEGGESWSEGSQNEKFYICGVPQGKYHLTLTPSKPFESKQNSYINVNVKWNQPSLWNVFLPIGIMAGIVILFYFLNLFFEQQRWSESNFSPYE